MHYESERYRDAANGLIYASILLAKFPALGQESPTNTELNTFENLNSRFKAKFRNKGIESPHIMLQQSSLLFYERIPM
jgi:hypothetical protein